MEHTLSRTMISNDRSVNYKYKIRKTSEGFLLKKWSEMKVHCYFALQRPEISYLIVY